MKENKQLSQTTYIESSYSFLPLASYRIIAAVSYYYL